MAQARLRPEHAPATIATCPTMPKAPLFAAICFRFIGFLLRVRACTCPGGVDPIADPSRRNRAFDDAFPYAVSTPAGGGPARRHGVPAMSEDRRTAEEIIPVIQEDVVIGTERATTGTVGPWSEHPL
jgi:hypothetical protein